MFQYNNEEEDFSRCPNESEEDDKGEIPVEKVFKKLKKGKKGRRGQWSEHLADGLVDNGKCRERLLLTNVKNVKMLKWSILRQCY